MNAFGWVHEVAQAKGFWEREGLNVQTSVITGGGTAATQMVVVGGVDLAAGGAELFIVSASKGADVVVVSVDGQKAPLRLVGSRDFKKPADLRGKRIAVPDLLQGATVVLRHFLAAYGLNEGDYKLVPAGGTSNRYAALKGGGVEAAILAQPVDFLALKEGFNDLGLATEVLSDWYFTGLSTNRTWARNNERALVAFFRAQRKAGQWLYDPANRKEALDILARYNNVSLEEANATYDLYIRDLKAISPTGEVRLEGLRPVVEGMIKSGLLEDADALKHLDRYLDSSYVTKARVD